MIACLRSVLCAMQTHSLRHRDFWFSVCESLTVTRQNWIKIFVRATRWTFFCMNELFLTEWNVNDRNKILWKESTLYGFRWLQHVYPRLDYKLKLDENLRHKTVLSRHNYLSRIFVVIVHFFHSKDSLTSLSVCYLIYR